MCRELTENKIYFKILFKNKKESNNLNNFSKKIKK